MCTCVYRVFVSVESLFSFIQKKRESRTSCDREEEEEKKRASVPNKNERTNHQREEEEEADEMHARTPRINEIHKF